MTALMYEMIYIWVIAAGTLSAFMPLLGYEKPGAAVVLITAFVSGVPALFRKSGWIGKLIISGVAVTLAVAGLFLRQNESVRSFFAQHTEWIPMLIIAVCASLLGEISAHIRYSRIVFSVIFAGGVIAEVILDMQPEKLLVTATLTYILLTLTEEIQRRWKREGYTDPVKHLVFIMPFVIMVMVPVLLLPAPDDPYDWAVFKRIYDSVSESIQKIGRHFSSDGVYDPTNVMIGFSGRGDLHGNVSHANDEVMELIDLSSAVTGIRLDGRSFDTFDGMAWTDTDPSAAYDGILDTVAFTAAVSEYTDKPADYYRRHSFRISYTGISTPYVFTPVKSLAGSDGSFQSVGYSGGDVVWKDNAGIPEQYWVTFFRMNTGNQVFNELIENAGIPDRAAYETQLQELSLNGYEDLSYEDYLDYRDRVYELYTQAPVISDDVQAWLDSIYEGADTETEKMDRLCRVLRKFEYTNTPGDFPEYVNDAGSLLDYFLLESPRGYCSYFATAFVLLARAEGLPARYVQGYLVETAGQRNVTVYTYMAHAWPEVYYDGIGWVPYEPTPGMGTYAYWRTEEEVIAMGQGASAGYPGAYEEEESLPEEEQGVYTEEEHGHVIPVRAIVIPVAAGAGFIILFFIIGNIISSISFRRKEISERYGIICRQDINLLRLLGYEAACGETLSEFGARIQGDTGPRTAVFVDDLTEFLYAGNTELEEPEKRAFEYRKELMSRLRRENILKFMGFCLSAGLRKSK
jgi:transglutaminase-like putative cysteine protease